MINQLNKDWNCTNEKMDAYYAMIRKLKDKFYGIEYHHVVWANNQAAYNTLVLSMHLTLALHEHKHH